MTGWRMQDEGCLAEISFLAQAWRVAELQKEAGSLEGRVTVLT